MKVCLIDPDQEYGKIFKDFMFGHAHVTQVFDAKSFGNMDIDFDCIIAEHDLPEISGEYLVESIRDKTAAQFAIISSDTNHFNQENLKNPAITGLFRKNKYDYQRIVDWVERIKYEKELIESLEEMIAEEVALKNL